MLMRLLRVIFCYVSFLPLMAGGALAADEATVPSTLSTGSPGDLLVAPTRVVFEGRTRTVEINLNNRGGKEATYRISFTHLYMDQEGAYKEITAEEAKEKVKPADELVRYSPRQVTLKPGESQVVKLMVRKPEALADGEYTSHLLFRAVPDLATGENVEQKSEQDDKIAVRLIPIYGVSIPVIVRQGDLAVQAKLQQIQRAEKTLQVTIARTGTRSVYGDLFVTRPGNKKEILGQIRGIAVMSYADTRKVEIPMAAPTTGPLLVEYRAREEDGGKTFDQVEVP